MLSSLRGPPESRAAPPRSPPLLRGGAGYKVNALTSSLSNAALFPQLQNQHGQIGEMTPPPRSPGSTVRTLFDDGRERFFFHMLINIGSSRGGGGGALGPDVDK